MSQQVSKQKTDSSGRLAVVGDRELVIGYRLIGIDDTFIVSDEEDASKKIQELYSSGEFGLIIASNSMRTKLSSKFLAEIEHENLKRITYGKRYDISNDKIKEMLLI